MIVAIHNSVSKRHASQFQAGLVEPICQACSLLQECLIPAAAKPAATIKNATWLGCRGDKQGWRLQPHEVRTSQQ